MEKFDLVIIGSGPGGYVAAIRAGQLGLKTAMVEKDKDLGGTCLNVGCIPSKALLTSSDHFIFAKKEAEKHGIVVGSVDVDLNKMQQRKEKVVKTLTGGVRALMKTNKVTTFEGFGTITAPGKVSVKSSDGKTQEIETKNIIIATGSAPIELPFAKFDGKTIVSSTEALTFTEPPREFLVIGAGAIGLELGSVWARLGSKVTILEFLPRIAVGFDLELSNLLQRSLTGQGITFHLETKVSAIKIDNGRVTATATRGNEELKFEAAKVLVSVGRKPFSEGLGAEKVGVEFDEKKRIKVDQHFKTNVDGIYAIGDVIAGQMLAHKAEDEGIACVERIAGKDGHINYDAIAGIIYTNPELAGVGLTEDQAKEKGIDYRVGRFPFRANARAIANDDLDGIVKFVADAKADRILGAHILQHAASELIAEAVSVIEFGGSSEDLARTCHSHPTLSEAVKEAAMNVEKRALHILNR
ncbi:MAG: dihydrolipoyl dehydrogenase [Verrucomicrobia bacterium]|nr:MAG: dihydrolipoyl dehydrogenase [Verrucomicrobiota bacterium]PYL95319.1 MAG: dihydrolipoyl dehydrogenase [Verrucomicrobiota bacterium]HTD00920.1 dihydrolipoyl dehydrogenase [Chthoniobacterales bacterium]